MNAASGLVARELIVRFGGLVAVDGVSFSAGPGRITGLIGPNGAGKSTCFNACSGLVRPSAGTVELDGRDISRSSVSERARFGLGRTFQRMELCDDLTVADNVALGREAALAGASVRGQLLSRRAERASIADHAAAAIEQCGLGRLAGTAAGSLSTGQRRLVELARALAGDFTILMLDEPSSGLDPRETEEFGDILLDAVSERGILLVEHDMALVMRVCSYIYVIDFGKPIFEGTPEEVRASEVVRRAYLGQEAA